MFYVTLGQFEGDSGARLEYKFHPEINQESAEIELRETLRHARNTPQMVSELYWSIIKSQQRSEMLKKSIFSTYSLLMLIK